MRKNESLLVRLLTGGVVVSLAACGGGGTSSPTPVVTTPTPVPCSQSVVLADQGQVPASSGAMVPFGTTAAGRLDITVDWTFAASPIGVYVLPGSASCNVDQFNARACNFLARSEPSSVKPRKLSVADAAAGSYQLLLANFSDVDESLSLQVVLSQGSCAPFAATVGTSRADGPWPQLKGMLH